MVVPVIFPVNPATLKYWLASSQFNENNFYKHIATNLEFIKKINVILEKFDITIDFISRVKSKKININNRLESFY